MYLEIIDDDAPFDFRPVDEETGEASDTVFQLRVLPDADQRRLDKQHTKPTFDKKARRMVDKRDDGAYVADVLDTVIVGWSGVKSARTGTDIPCSREMKARLPERLKVEILRLAVGKEVGSMLAEEKKRSMSTSTSSATTAPD